MLERIAPAQAWRLLLVVERAFGLPESAFAASRRSWPQSRSDPDARISPQPTYPAGVNAGFAAKPPVEIQKSSPDGARFAVRPPWEEYIDAGSIPVELGASRRALLGVALAFRRAPQSASSAAFGLQLGSWLAMEREREDQSADAEEPETLAEARPAVGVAPSGSNDASVMPQAVPESDDVPGTPPDRARTPVTEGVPSSLPAVSDFPNDVAATAAINEKRASSLQSTFDAADPSARAAAPGDAVTIQADTRVLLDSTAEKTLQESRLQFEGGCHTCAGGVFYLIHLLRKSEILRFDIGLSGWALLELVARSPPRGGFYCDRGRSHLESAGPAGWP